MAQYHKIHLAVDALSNPVRIIITASTVADCNQVEELIEEIPAQNLLEDRGYDTDDIVEFATIKGMAPVIPRRKCLSQAQPVAWHCDSLC